MTTRNKILLSVGAVCLVAVIAVVAVVAVFAARTQQVNSTIKVSYTASEVEGSVSAKYYTAKNPTGTAMTKDGQAVGGGNDSYAFSAGNGSQGGELKIQGESISLDDADEDKAYVIFEYKFTNSGEKDYKATLTFAKSKAENVKVYVFDQATQYEGFATWSYSEEEDKTSETSYFTDELVAHKSDADTEHYFYVVVEVENVGTDASFEGSFNWTLAGQKTNQA